MIFAYPGWFGMRSEFCPFLLHHCPFLTIYGNISYSKKNEQENEQVNTGSSQEQQSTYTHVYASSNADGKVTRTGKGNKFECIVPIDTPD